MLGPTKFTAHVITTNLTHTNLAPADLTTEQWCKITEFITEAMYNNEIHIRDEKLTKMGIGTEDFRKECERYSKKLVSEWKHKFLPKELRVEVKPEIKAVI